MYVDFNTLRVFINDFWRMCTLISVKADLDKYWERCPNNVYNVYTSYMKYIIMNFLLIPVNSSIVLFIQLTVLIA